MNRNWNEHQEIILEDAENGRGDVVVIARAGTGKTTTMLEAARRFPAGCSIVYLAFNSRIKEEVSAKAPRGVDVRTLHALGRGALFLVAKGKGRQLPEPDGAKTRKLIDREWPGILPARRAALVSASGFAKNVLASTESEIACIVGRLDLDIGTDPTSPKYREDLVLFCKAVLEVMERSLADFFDRLEYDFDDMIWIPVRAGLRVKQFDRVIVDEGQDLNACQHRLVRMARRSGGRIVLVGDDRQAIYSWRGADDRGIERFVDELGARVLRLPVTYRCGRVIVELAKTAVPDYEAAFSNVEGVVEYVGEERMVEDARPGDAILSRVNAPLVGMCLRFLKEGRRARVVGRDVGRGLLVLIGDAEKDGASDIPSLAKWISIWEAAEIDRVLSKDPPGDPDAISDRAECVHALSEGATSIAAVKARISELFTDDVRGAESFVVLSSTHKAKGLEWSTVWMLADTYRRERSTEEENLWYVAVTRAISRLVLVSKRHVDVASAVSVDEKQEPPSPGPQTSVDVVGAVEAKNGPKKHAPTKRKGKKIFEPSPSSPLWAPLQVVS